MSNRRLTFCIFSFNRGQFLKNCVDSIRTCVPGADIAIFDDDSTDPDTLRYLEEAARYCEIIKPRAVGKIKHGGLYLNMQMALEHCADRPMVCYLQDDTQLVRPLGDDELGQLEALFGNNPGLGFVHPCFIRGIDLRKRPVVAIPGENERTFYRQDKGQSAGIHYSDLLVTVPARLLDKNWRFFQSEPGNDQQAKQLFGSMLYLYDPFAMWLPEVPAYRGKKKTRALKWAEAKKGCGFFPFEVWAQDRSDQFRARRERDVPVAETYLNCSPEPRTRPWTYNPLTGLGWLKKLNSIEVFLDKLGKRLSGQ